MTWFISEAALRDVDEIEAWTAQKWDDEQAYLYIAAIFDAVARLSHSSFRWSVESVRPGLFRAKAGSHLIFYRITELDEVHVVRVLHEVMDIPSHL
jgi:toxin ParE1/3/4